MGIKRSKGIKGLRDRMDPRVAVCVEAKGVKDGSSCVGAKGTEGPMRTK